MNLLENIKKGYSKAQVDRICAYIGADKGRFSQLVALYLKGPYRITQRAAGPLAYCVEDHPELVRPHLSKLLTYAKKKDVPDAVKRNTVRLLQFIELPKVFHGRIAKLCFDFFRDRTQAIAIRVFSMTVLARLAKQEPALTTELRVLIEDELPYATPAFISRARKILKQLP